MPIPKGTILSAIPSMLASKISAYNTNLRTAAYNIQYKNFIAAREVGILTSGSLGSWITDGEAAPVIQALLTAFGMHAQNSVLVAQTAFQQTLLAIDLKSINWISNFTLPLAEPPTKIVNPTTGATLSAELQAVYKVLATPSAVTVSGGFVAASKTLHCLFPGLAPIIDGRHTGISYYNIDSATYDPPLGLPNWFEWIGEPITGKLNPSPRGAGRNGWQKQQFMAAVGVNQRIYELWQLANSRPGLQVFLAIDPTQGTTGIPRIIDKTLW